MNRVGFIFLCSFYLALSTFSYANELAIDIQLFFCATAIILFGIPHGAIDHLLFIKNTPFNKIHFFLSYFLAMSLYLVLWYYSITWGLILFLFLSAYHFGESQLNDISLSNRSIKIITYFLWGINILSALVYYNLTEITELFSSVPDLVVTLSAFQAKVYSYILIASSILILTLFVFYTFTEQLHIEFTLKEIVILILIHLSFYLLPLILGFTLYFVILHSIKVLIDEYQFLKKEFLDFNLLGFAKQLAPFTLLSVLGAALLYYLSFNEIINISVILLSIVLISVVTLPHALVMFRFYQKNQL